MSANSTVLRACALLGASAIAFLPTLALAQQAPDMEEQPSGEIVVTAQKRAERAADVPLSLSVLGGEALEAARLTQADDLANLQGFCRNLPGGAVLLQPRNLGDERSQAADAGAGAQRGRAGLSPVRAARAPFLLLTSFENMAF